MRNPPRILVADDNPANIDIIQMRLAHHGYEIVTAADGEEALTQARSMLPDLILLDVMMPKKDGLQVCRDLKADKTLPFMPVILVTARSETRDIIAGLDCGADEYLTKPVDHGALVARVRSILRTKQLHDEVQEQARRLEAQAQELAGWNQTLETRVAEQLRQIEALTDLKRFLPPQVAELVMTSGNAALLESHRREVTVVFCDLRGFTSFAELSEPEEVLHVLREYHAALGHSIQIYEGTLERFAGDGLLVVFNDPVPCADHSERAAGMALDMRDRIAALGAEWRSRGHELGFGVGIARGFATLGRIGFEGRSDYAAIGTVSNLASRLCDEAKSGQILVSQKVLAALGPAAEAVDLGEFSLKGFTRKTPVYELVSLRQPSAGAQGAALASEARAKEA